MRVEIVVKPHWGMDSGADVLGLSVVLEILSRYL